MSLRSIALATLATLDAAHAASDTLADLDAVYDACDVCAARHGTHTADCGVGMRERLARSVRLDWPRDADSGTGAPRWFLR
jgi:hypothetical protein